MSLNNRSPMCKKDRKCCAWISLDSLGISAQGCLRDSYWLQTLSIPSNQSIFNQALYIDLPTEKLMYIKNVAHGKFGYIDLAQYNTHIKHSEVYVKRPILPGKSLLYEACVQKLVKDSLASIGFPTGAPSVISLFRLKDNSICFSMEQINGAVTLDKYLETLSKGQFLTVIIDCLLQLSAMIWHLDMTLGINHRDLKPSNFLIVEHDTPIRKIINVENEILEIESRHSLTFIEFGFSCLGSTETHISDISLSTVYSKCDPCPKEGRDMYLFLAFLYIDYHTKLPPKLLALFESWLNIPGSNLCSFMRKDKENSKKWLYFMAGNENIKRFNSCPSKIIIDLQALI
jgi:serine/threonine protein kinase